MDDGIMPLTSKDFYQPLMVTKIKVNLSEALNTRDRATHILKNTEVGQLTEEQYLRELRKGFQMLELQLANRNFLLGDSIKEVDLSVFMCIQAFLDPSLKDECELTKGFTELCRWARRIDIATSTNYTKPLQEVVMSPLEAG